LLNEIYFRSLVHRRVRYVNIRYIAIMLG